MFASARVQGYCRSGGFDPPPTTGGFIHGESWLYWAGSLSGTEVRRRAGERRGRLPIVPTINERDNIADLVQRLKTCLAGRSWEVIFVDDDSADGTAEVVRRISRREPRVRCIQRIGRRGLSSACVEGMLASSAPYLPVMDADSRHDETLLPIMLDTVMQEDLDVVVGGRYLAGGGIGGNPRRRRMELRGHHGLHMAETERLYIGGG